MLFVIALVFDLLGCFFVERNRDVYYNQTRRPQSEASSFGFKYPFKDAADESGKSGLVNNNGASWPNTLVVKDLCYFVPIKKKHTPRRCKMQSILGPCLVRCFRKKKGSAETSLNVEGTNELQLLSGVDAVFRRGRMTALMGYV